ncbi:spore germination protein [Paenibacillus lautus]|uniref:Spore germination protein n=1 Tax=Paenibacillus lautus TaxID=1401 RepID=A0A385TJ16_PAELA|nr:spore germination protein [Paenibacillus lautus]AYB43626.1 spore germination protein [Paenibacillus lautus]MBY0161179.1 spore germination protein [Cytobacillus firmus]
MSMTEQQLRDRYADSDDVYITSYPGMDAEPWAIMVYSPMMCDSKVLSEVFLPVISKEWNTSVSQKHPFDPASLRYYLTLDVADANMESVDDIVYSGYIALYFPKDDKLYSYSAGKTIGRTPEESATETSVKGPRDGFVEELDINVSLIRKRLKSPGLVYSSFKLGDKSKTTVGIMYLKDKVIPETVTAIVDKLNHYTGDPPVGIGELAEHLTPYRFSVLPMFDYTGRTDLAYDSLTRGRLVIIMQGSPVLLIAPASFMQLLFAAEDPQMPFYFVMPWRILRMVGFLISIFLPGFYITLLSFHQDQIPFPLLATVANTRLGLPIPTGFEMLIILFLLSLLREAGMQMPSPIASTITVVSGIIIGDAAIRGGFFSPTMTVIGALSFVAGSTHSNQDFVVSQTIFRFFVLTLSSVFGLFGFFISVFLIVQYAANHNPFGQPYLAPFSPFSISKILGNLFRFPGKRKKGGAL